MHRHFVIALLASGCHFAPQPVLDRAPDFRRGVSLGLFAPDEEVDYEAELGELRALGATDVSLVVTWVQEDARASEVRERAPYSAPAPLIRRLVRRAHALGLRVMLFPILRLVHRTAEEWRGSIQPADLGRWFDSYRALLLALGRLAADEKVDVLSIGSELASTERKSDEWARLIGELRRVYPGPLLYSANWDRYTEVPFWSSVDLMGVSAYWSVSEPGARPTVEGAVAAWQPHRMRLAEFRRRIGRPMILTEVGYQSVRGAGAAPWNDFPTGVDGAQDEEAQRRLYEGFTRAWSDEPALDGVYFWIWFDAGGRGDRGYTPRRKAAEHVVRAWYRRPEQVPPPR